jgi:hypothetical protein
MITGVHFLLYSKEPEGDRAFLRDVLGFHSVDAGGGWLIFTLPPCEMGVHPATRNFVHPESGGDVLGAVPYLMCDDLAATVHSLGAAGGACPQPVEEDWGVVTTVRLPGGGELGLYQPKHPTAV